MHESCLKCSMWSVKHFNASREKCSVNPGEESEPSTVWPGACELAFHLCSDKIIPTACQPSSSSNNFKVLFEVRGSHTYNPAGFLLIVIIICFFYFHIYLHYTYLSVSQKTNLKRMMHKSPPKTYVSLIYLNSPTVGLKRASYSYSLLVTCVCQSTYSYSFLVFLDWNTSTQRKNVVVVFSLKRSTTTVETLDMSPYCLSTAIQTSTIQGKAMLTWNNCVDTMF